jgi:hypothetical protein
MGGDCISDDPISDDSPLYQCDGWSGAASGKTPMGGDCIGDDRISDDSLMTASVRSRRAGGRGGGSLARTTDYTKVMARVRRGRVVVVVGRGRAQGCRVGELGEEQWRSVIVSVMAQ